MGWWCGGEGGGCRQCGLRQISWRGRRMRRGMRGTANNSLHRPAHTHPTPTCAFSAARVSYRASEKTYIFMVKLKVVLSLSLTLASLSDARLDTRAASKSYVYTSPAVTQNKLGRVAHRSSGSRHDAASRGRRALDCRHFRNVGHRSSDRNVRRRDGRWRVPHILIIGVGEPVCYGPWEL